MDVAVDITKTTIETERLLLWAWQEADINDFYEYASVPGVGEMAGWPHHESIDVSRRILQTFISEKNVFAIIYNQSKRVIEKCGFSLVKHSRYHNNQLQMTFDGLRYILFK